MPRVVIKENEGLDEALRRFKRQVSRNGTLAEARKREYYVKPGVKRKLKQEAARKARRFMKPPGYGIFRDNTLMEKARREHDRAGP